MEKAKSKLPELKKTTSIKNRAVIIFLSSDVRPWYQVSTSTEAINMKFLPDGTIYSKRHPRKWIQIQI